MTSRFWLRMIAENRPVEIIYFSSSGEISRRWIRIKQVLDQEIMAYCYLRKQPRKFHLQNVLAAQPGRVKRQQKPA